MAFQTPPEVQLTDTQQKALAQIISFKNLFPIVNRNNIPRDKHITLFDYLKKFTESVIGPQAFQVMLQSFLDRLFDPNDDKLDNFIIKSLDKSFEKNNITIVQGQTNLEWLNANVKVPLHASLVLTKALIVKQIITMIFGPKEKMSDDPKEQERLLTESACADAAFSVSNEVNMTQGDVEFNNIELRERLKRGDVQFTISCQDVKIKLPDSVLNDIDVQISKNQKIPGSINPANFFTSVTNYVGQETQRINAPQNTNAIKKDFGQILVEKVLSLITTAIDPHILFIFQKIQNDTGTKIEKSTIVVTPCQLHENPDDEKKSSFANTLINLIYAFLCTIILRLLVKQVKKIIKNAMAKKALNKTQKEIERNKRRFGFLNPTAAELQQAEKVLRRAELVKRGLNILNEIYEFEQKV